MSNRPLTDIFKEGRKPVSYLAPLLGEAKSQGVEFSRGLISEAREFGVDLRDYLTLKIDPRIDANAGRFDNLNGYEAALAYLNLPLKDDMKNGIVLQAASETFQMYPGTRALFPPVIDDMVRFTYRQDIIEQVAPLLANSRTISGPELLSTVIDDQASDYQVAGQIAESGRIPVKSIFTTEHSVRIFKHGMGYRTTYEFNRRARLDILTPYAARAARELERSKMKQAVSLLINGDSVFAASPVVNQSSFDASTGFVSTAGKLNYQNLLRWFVSRASVGVPVDTVVGNWDAYFAWLQMFGVPIQGLSTASQDAARMGFEFDTKKLVGGPITFAISSDIPEGNILGMSKWDTLEELVEGGSLIEESERSMANQTITYYRTENTGYRLIYGDTRELYDYNA